MPKAQFFKRTWLFATDDLVFFGLFFLLLRSISLALLIYKQNFEDFSECFINYNSSKILLLCMIIFNTLGLILSIFITFFSSKGLIMKPKERNSVPFYYVSHFILTFFDSFIILIWFTLRNTIESSGCFKMSRNITCATILQFIVVLRHQLHFWGSFDPNGHIWYLYLNNQLEDEKFHDLLVKSWTKRLKLIQNSKGTSKRSKIFFSKAAEMLVSFFQNSDLTASDAFAATVLLHEQTKIWINCDWLASKTTIEKTTRVWTPHGEEPIDREDDQLRTKRTFQIKYDPIENDWLNLKLIKDLAVLCTSAYGCSMFAVSDTKKFCNMCCNTKSTPEFEENNTFLQCQETLLKNYGLDEDPEAEPSIRHRCLCCARLSDCNVATYVHWGRIPTKDLIYLNKTNKMFSLSFAVVALPKYQRIVIVIRGTWSTQDALLDIVAQAKKVNLEGQENSEFYAHNGMLEASNTIFRFFMTKKILEYSICKMDKLHGSYKKYSISVCGHSLGAGVATILSAQIRSKFTDYDVRGYAFSAPLGMLNYNFAEYCKDFVVTVNYGFDIISRLSIETCEDLKARMISALDSCPDKKWILILKACWSRAFGKFGFFKLPNLESTNCDYILASNRLKSNIDFRSPVSYLDTNKLKLLGNPNEYHFDINGNNPNRLPISCSPLIIHIVEVSNEEDSDKRKLKSKDNLHYPVAIFSDIGQMKTILVHNKMMNDHNPMNIVSALDRICSKVYDETPSNKIMNEIESYIRETI